MQVLVKFQEILTNGDKLVTEKTLDLPREVDPATAMMQLKLLCFQCLDEIWTEAQRREFPNTLHSRT